MSLYIDVDDVEAVTAEQWRPVAGWEGCYSVSDRGRVRSEDREILVVTRWNNLAVRRVTGRLPLRGPLRLVTRLRVAGTNTVKPTKKRGK